MKDTFKINTKINTTFGTMFQIFNTNQEAFDGKLSTQHFPPEGPIENGEEN